MRKSNRIWILESLNDQNEFSDDVLTYIAGFANRKIMLKESCVFCKKFLINSKIRSTSDLIRCKNEGRLIQPDHRVNIITKTTDQIFRQYQFSDNIFVEKHLIDKIFMLVKKILDMKFSNLFDCLDEHVDSLSSETSHKNKFIKKIVATYLTLRCRHLAKQKNFCLHRKRIRKTFSKLILFKNQ